MRRRVLGPGHPLKLHTVKSLAATHISPGSSGDKTRQVLVHSPTNGNEQGSASRRWRRATVALRIEPTQEAPVCLVCTWPKCGKAFAASSALKRHTRTHTREGPYVQKPYVCFVC